LYTLTASDSREPGGTICQVRFVTACDGRHAPLGVNRSPTRCHSTPARDCHAGTGTLRLSLASEVGELSIWVPLSSLRARWRVQLPRRRQPLGST